MRPPKILRTEAANENSICARPGGNRSVQLRALFLDFGSTPCALHRLLTGERRAEVFQELEKITSSGTHATFPKLKIVTASSI